MAEGQSGGIELVVPGALEFEPVVIQSAGSVAAQLGFRPERIEDVKTVVGEAFVNAVEHGNRGRSNRRVTIRFFSEAEGLRIEVADSGRGFDPQRIPELSLREKIQEHKPARGWGLFLIRHLVNQLEVRRRFLFGSCLSLTIRPDQPATVKQADR